MKALTTNIVQNRILLCLSFSKKRTQIEIFHLFESIFQASVPSVMQRTHLLQCLVDVGHVESYMDTRPYGIEVVQYLRVEELPYVGDDSRLMALNNMLASSLSLQPKSPEDIFQTALRSFGLDLRMALPLVGNHSGEKYLDYVVVQHLLLDMLVLANRAETKVLFVGGIGFQLRRKTFPRREVGYLTEFSERFEVKAPKPICPRSRI